MVERVFGDYLVKCKVIPEPEAPAKEEAEAQVPVEDEHMEEEKPAHQFYEQVSVEDALIKTNTQYVAVLFTAEYCPPCHAFM